VAAAAVPAPASAPVAASAVSARAHHRRLLIDRLLTLSKVVTMRPKRTVAAKVTRRG